MGNKRMGPARIKHLLLVTFSSSQRSTAGNNNTHTNSTKHRLQDKRRLVTDPSTIATTAQHNTITRTSKRENYDNIPFNMKMFPFNINILPFKLQKRESTTGTPQNHNDNYNQRQK